MEDRDILVRVVDSIISRFDGDWRGAVDEFLSRSSRNDVVLWVGDNYVIIYSVTVNVVDGVIPISITFRDMVVDVTACHNVCVEKSVFVPRDIFNYVEGKFKDLILRKLK